MRSHARLILALVLSLLLLSSVPRPALADDKFLLDDQRLPLSWTCRSGSVLAASTSPDADKPLGERLVENTDIADQGFTICWPNIKPYLNSTLRQRINGLWVYPDLDDCDIRVYCFLRDSTGKLNDAPVDLTAASPLRLSEAPTRLKVDGVLLHSLNENFPAITALPAQNIKQIVGITVVARLSASIKERLKEMNGFATNFNLPCYIAAPGEATVFPQGVGYYTRFEAIAPSIATGAHLPVAQFRCDCLRSFGTQVVRSLLPASLIPPPPDDYYLLYDPNSAEFMLLLSQTALGSKANSDNGEPFWIDAMNIASFVTFHPRVIP